MKYRLTDLPRLACTSPGRAEPRLGALGQVRPLVSRVASADQTWIGPDARPA